VKAKTLKPQLWKTALARRLLGSAPEARSIVHAVELIASRLLTGIESPPSDLKALATALGVCAWSEDPNLPVSGELRREGAEFRIFLAPGQSRGRQRFTIAHELGHAFFEHTGDRPPRHGEELERLCDMLATEFLMPTQRVRTYLGAEPTAERIIEMARVFDVSLTAAAYRFSELTKTHVFGLDADQTLMFKRGAIDFRDSELQAAAQPALSGQRVDARVFLSYNRVWNGPWRLQGAPVNGAKAVFLLRPLVNAAR